MNNAVTAPVNELTQRWTLTPRASEVIGRLING